jgi:AdoMet-dependent rRNA methyltransferase SPB1
MTAPEDLDNDDRALGGEEMFDLGEGEEEMKRGHHSKKGLKDLVRDEDGMSESEESEEEEEEDNEVYSSDEERELKTQGLEGALDGLYDAYRERMSEKDAKWKVKQARLRDKNYEKWGGIKEGSDDEDDGVDKGYKDRMVRQPRRGDVDEEEEEESEDGGWDVLAAEKAKLGEEVSSDEDSSDEEGEANPNSRKTKMAISSTGGASASSSSTRKAKAQPLVTSLQDKEKRAEMSRQAQVWFDQSVFKGVEDLVELDEEDEDDEMSEDGDDEDEDGDEEDQVEGDVDMENASALSSTLDDDVSRCLCWISCGC